MEKHKQSYTRKELLQNESFLRWRYFPTKEDEFFWETLRNDPVIRTEIEAAIEILKTTRFNDYSLSDRESMNMLRLIERRIQKKKSRHKAKLYMAASFAAAVLFLGIISVPLFMNRATNEEPGIIANNKDIQIIMGNESLAIDQDADFLYNESGDITILKEKEKILENKKVEAVGMNKLIVPKGKRSSLTLSDGTKIWVNSGSVLEFPAVFAKDAREIQVEGEIYLEVAENKRKPFIVNTSQLSVKVLGTQFSISDYKDDASRFVVLVEGAVEVTAGAGKVNLQPEQMASVTGGSILTQEVDVYNYISWKDGLMQFTSEPLSNIAIRLARYYDKPIICEEGSAGLKCTGKLVLFETPEKVLETIAHTNPVKFKTVNDTIFISRQ